MYKHGVVVLICQLKKVGLIPGNHVALTDGVIVRRNRFNKCLYGRIPSISYLLSMSGFNMLEAIPMMPPFLINSVLSFTQLDRSRNKSAIGSDFAKCGCTIRGQNEWLAKLVDFI